MKRKWWFRGFVVLTAAFGLIAGCAKEEKNVGTTQPVAEKKDQKHDGWWCDEHGVPEAECSMCSSKAAKECKAKGDWCKEHQRAKSQCFLCDPSLREKYAARYRAKYGKEPPPPEENMPKKDKAEKEEKDLGKK